MASQTKSLEDMENGVKLMMIAFIESLIPINHQTKKYIFICIFHLILKDFPLVRYFYKSKFVFIYFVMRN